MSSATASHSSSFAQDSDHGVMRPGPNNSIVPAATWPFATDIGLAALASDAPATLRPRPPKKHPLRLKSAAVSFPGPSAPAPPTRRSVATKKEEL
ncbi:hypothetical protein CGLO_12780 [Colletotrichum gloeosporioides Cg-14]|uniref:Uncharacterized protein n=1 Tax=Colletotrichum gloeosporioides (strain Cg-14) TaxID=1237896 RepID=T0K4Y4_COLGC|nr:hypothetical protein CGLO_12780 [Colletotrichum gloeosporioides Cg-14]